MNINKKTFSFLSNDKKEISFITWTPETDKPKAIIQIVHGMSEYANRYDDFAKYLCSNNYIVYANDHRGHGFTLNDSKVGFFGKKNGWNIIVDDLKKINQIIRENYNDLPIIMFGHSMGSVMARTFAINYGRFIDALILCGSPSDPGQKAIYGIALAKTLGFLVKPHTKSNLLNYLTFRNYNKLFKPKYSNFDFLSRDRNEVEKYIKDPLCGFVCSNRFFVDLLEGLQYVNKIENINRMPKHLPIFFISGDKDPVGNYRKGVKIIFDIFINNGYNNSEYKFYNEARHELINEINKKEVYDDVLKWIEKQNF